MAKRKAPKTRKEGPTKCWRRTGGKGGTYLTCAESARPGAPQLRKGSKPKMVRRKPKLVITGVEPSPKRKGAGKKPKRTKQLLIVDDDGAPKKAAAKKPRTEAQKAASRKSSAAYRARKKAGK